MIINTSPHLQRFLSVHDPRRLISYNAFNLQYFCLSFHIVISSFAPHLFYKGGTELFGRSNTNIRQGR